MSNISDLMWYLESKNLKVHSYNDGSNGEECLINMFMDSENVLGWKNLINILNKVYDHPLQFIQHSFDVSKPVLCSIIFKTKPEDSQKLEQHIRILKQCVVYDEYKIHEACNGNVFDIKLGVSCNNNCFHCVIKPQIYDIKRQYPDEVVLDSGIGMQCTRDLTYQQVINILESLNDDVTEIVLTGGEPTFRNDFINILKWIYYNRPHMKVSIQTNGRNLSNINLVKQIRRYTRYASFAIAMHGLEETHNKVVNNRKEKGNPYTETVEGIRNLLKIFGTDNCGIRTEIVLSSHNIDEILDTVKFQYEDLGVKTVGISYPHLAGFSSKDINEISPDITKVYESLEELNKYNLARKDLNIFIEEVPFCIFNKINNEIKLRSFENRDRTGTIVNYNGSQENDFHSAWIKDHFKYKKCKKCILDKECVGVWKESKEQVRDFVQPIEKLSENLEKFLSKEWQCYDVGNCDEGEK